MGFIINQQKIYGSGKEEKMENHLNFYDKVIIEYTHIWYKRMQTLLSKKPTV